MTTAVMARRSERRGLLPAVVAAMALQLGCRQNLVLASSAGAPSWSLAAGSPGTLSGNSSNDITFDFAQVAVGQELVATLELSNEGVAPLSIVGVDSPADAEFGVNLPTVTLQPGASIPVSVSFKPFSVGQKATVVAIHDDSSSAPTVVLNLKGQGVLVQLGVDPQTVDFGLVVIGSSLTKTITLTNLSDLDFTISPSPIEGMDSAPFSYDPVASATASLALRARGGTQSLGFAYHPTVPSSPSVPADIGQVILTPSLGPPVVVELRGVAAISGLQISPDPIDFGFVKPGTLLVESLHVRNVANLPIDIRGVAVSQSGGGVFSIPSGTIVSATPLAPGAKLDIPTQFSPQTATLYLGQISVLSDDNEPQIDVPLQGFGGGAAISCSPTALDFGVVATGIGSSLPLLCTNTGSDVPGHPEAGLLIGSLPTTNASFSAAIDALTPTGYLGAGQTALLDVSYVPTSATSDHGTLTIDSNVINPPTPPVVQLSGQGIAVGKCNYILTPAALNWGLVPSDDPTLVYTQAFVVQNLGPNPCVVSSLHLSDADDGAFALPNGPVVSQLLAPPGNSQAVDGGTLPTSLTVPVSFAATGGARLYGGRVAFTVSDPDAPENWVNLSASAANSCFLLRPDPLDLGVVGLTGSGQFCSDDRRSFVGVNNCSQDVTISSVSLSGNDFSESGQTLPITVAAGTSSPPVSVSFSPAAAGSYFGAIAVQTDLNPTPFEITLKGTAIAGTQMSDTFAGSAVPMVDILWVVDSDDLQFELNDTLAVPPNPLGKLDEFVNAAQGIDYQMAVVSDDCPAFDNGNLEPCATCFTVGDQAQIITSNDADPAGELRSLINGIAVPPTLDGKGVCSTYYNATMTAAVTALQPDLLDGHNIGFLRDGATLAVVVFDPDGYSEDEGSPNDTSYYLNFFDSLKGGSSQLVNVSVMFLDVYGDFPPSTRYIKLTHDSGGFMLDTEGANWTKQIPNLWTTFTAGSSGYVLSGTPVPSSIQLWENGPPPGSGVNVPGVQIPQASAGGTWNWKYVPLSNSIVMNSSVVIGPTDTVTVVYSLACGGS